MAYSDEYHGNSKLMYDGQLIDFFDAAKRIERDNQRIEKYKELEENLDSNQLTWDEVEKKLK